MILGDGEIAIEAILTEDVPSGMVVEGVRFVNPFATGFEIDDWV